MTTRYWRELWLGAMNPVFYDSEPLIDLNVFDPKRYPPLEILKTYDELSILILAWCILQTEDTEFTGNSKEVSVSELEELFENALYTSNEIWSAITKLVNKRWVDIDVLGPLDNLNTIVWADLDQLEKDHLFTPNKWSHLHRTGVYTQGINYNW